MVERPGHGRPASLVLHLASFILLNTFPKTRNIPIYGLQETQNYSTHFQYKRLNKNVLK